MRFTIRVKSQSDEWNEEYDKEVADPKVWAQQIVEGFNERLRPGELPRILLKVTISGPGRMEHQWAKRTGGMSVNFRGATVDLMYCSRCDITGKRYGFNSHVKIDSKYRAKKYQECTNSRADSAGDS